MPRRAEIYLPVSFLKSISVKTICSDHVLELRISLPPEANSKGFYILRYDHLSNFLFHYFYKYKRHQKTSYIPWIWNMSFFIANWILNKIC